MKEKPDTSIKRWTTQIEAKDPRDNSMKIWSGPLAYGRNTEEATEYLQDNGLGYCRVIGEFIEEGIFTYQINKN